MSSFASYCAVIFWNFTRKDNVVYNFNIIAGLINDACASKNKQHYYKPIIILMMSIIECTLCDFLWRIKQERHEGLNLSKNEKNTIRAKDIPKQLFNYVKICEKHRLLGNPKSMFILFYINLLI